MEIISKINKINDKLNDLEELINLNSSIIIAKLNETINKLRRSEIRSNKTEIDKKYHESIKLAQLENKKNGTTGRIRVGRVAGLYEKGRKYPIAYGYMNISVVSLNKGKLGSELSPYVLKDNNGNLHENIWQFSKIYQNVPYQNQKSGWKWNKERHVDQKHLGYIDPKIEDKPTVNSYIKKEYWEWRKKGMRHPKPVRFPVGLNERHFCLGCIWPYDDNYEKINNPDYPMKVLDYAESRKIIYSTLYFKLAKETNDFKKLKEMLNDGINIMLLDFDGPRPSEMKDEIYGEDGVGSVEINEQNIKLLLNDIEHPFGHAYSLAVLLLDHTEWILDG